MEELDRCVVCGKETSLFIAGVDGDKFVCSVECKERYRNANSK